jgi:membrane-associated phospholipid phosphatase
MTDMAPGGTQFSGPDRYRGQLIIVLDLIAVCLIVQLFLDRWVAEALTQYQLTAVAALVKCVPDRAKLSLLFLSGMMVLIAYRLKSGDRSTADRGMFVLGSGVVAGFAADALKVIFGRSRPEALLTDGAYGFHFFSGGNGFDSFPSSHAAIAAGVAGALSVVWPNRRRLFIPLAAAVAASRFIDGAHYLSDALFGFAVGLGVAMLMHMLFHRCGIPLGSAADR